MDKCRLLLLDDDADFASELAEYLQSYGFAVTAISEITELFSALNSGSKPDAVLLDQFIGPVDILPKISEIRAVFSGAVLVLTGNKQEMDRVIGLEVGSDDFLLKSQSPREILARIRAVMRRIEHKEPPPQRPAVVIHGDWQPNPSAFDLIGPGGARAGLTGAQYRTLEILWANAGKPVEREKINTYVFGQQHTTVSRSVDVLVSQVRRKLASACGDDYQIRAIRGSGYVFSRISEGSEHIETALVSH